MKVIGKKDLSQGKSISKMLMVYGLCLLIVVLLFFLIKNYIILGSALLAVLFLIIERGIALIKFRRIPLDMITMHRNHIEIKLDKMTRIVHYQEIKNIIVDIKHNKMIFELIDNTTIIVKHILDMGRVKKEILDYKRRYF